MVVKLVTYTASFSPQSDRLGDKIKEQANEIQAKTDEISDFLIVDITRAQDQLANNWGWITTSGVLTMALGALALLLPITATNVAYTGTVFTIAATGIVYLLGALFREEGNRLKSGVSGVLYSALAYYMTVNPAQGLNFVTLTIASVIAVEGLYESALAIKNKNLQGRPWHLASGVVSVLASVWLTTNIPVSSLFAPGAALGTRLTSNGGTKVAVGLRGKELADSRKRNQ